MSEEPRLDEMPIPAHNQFARARFGFGRITNAANIVISFAFKTSHVKPKSLSYLMLARTRNGCTNGDSLKQRENPSSYKLASVARLVSYCPEQHRPMSSPAQSIDFEDQLRMVVRDDPVIYKLNLVQTALLLINVLANIPSFFGQKTNCTTLSIITYVIHYLSLLTINTVLYIEAYYSSRRSRFIACVCIIILAVQTACLVQNLREGEFILSPNGGCQIHFPSGWSIGMAVSTSILTLFLIGMFIMNLYRLPDLDHTQAYRIMIRDSVLFGLFICLFDILFVVLESIKLLDTGIALTLNWVIKSRLMTVMMTIAYRRRKSHRKNSLGIVESATELDTKICFGECHVGDKNFSRVI
ncbi:hypothetical protein K493DRAFT_405801 [Basidiobolus meristosporus CBS 931.73]|uniref:G-protein coupled receptors family 3 profile domain-containing protein n=1 Tax=Basidiobolus meristosporus CBS 931.73 TaxID=1314790 RepID=A0A1Y1YRM6_9FUNG|nr:hypothetical protein K493DRAFT_405801 [Basidiobolus meristosporus CBS 931.73]|eukprot:ORY00682.1 hypothetical protein K493DRAFT_405801 [Basidiobolus meristosporus CBS 931.73]